MSHIVRNFVSHRIGQRHTKVSPSIGWRQSILCTLVSYTHTFSTQFLSCSIHRNTRRRQYRGSFTTSVLLSCRCIYHRQSSKI